MTVSTANPFVNILLLLLVVYWWLVVFRMLVDTAPGLRNSLGPNYSHLFRWTEPAIRPFRRWVPPAWGVDLSMIATLISLLIIQELVVFAARHI